VGFSLSTYCYFDLIVDNPDHGYFVVFRRAIACYEYDHNQLNESTRSRICVRIDTERSRNNGIGTVTRRGEGGLDLPGLQSRQGHEIFLFCYLNRFWSPSYFILNGYQLSFLRLKWPGSSVDRLPPSSA
jgi:hypothetical protein